MNLRLMLCLFFYALVPVVYKSIRIHFLGDYENIDALGIASQIKLLEVLLEMLQEAIIAPMFFILTGMKGSREKFNMALGNILLVICFVCTAVCIVAYCFMPDFVIFVKQQDELIAQTIVYLRLEIFGLSLGVIASFFIVVAIIRNDYRILIVCIATKLCISIICDFIFLSYMKIGVNSIAYANIIMHSFVVLLCFVRYLKICRFSLRSFDSSWYFISLKKSSLSGLESFIRNMCFLHMILVMINQVGEQGNFFVALEFLWVWLLLPILQFGEYVKNDVAHDCVNLPAKFVFYARCVTCVVLVWLFCIPIYEWFLQTVLNSKEHKVVMEVVLLSLPFYVVFAYGFVITNIFYGIGAINFVLYQSLFVNLFIYGGAFYFYKMEIYQPTLHSTILLFGSSMTCGAIINFILFYLHCKKINIG